MGRSRRSRRAALDILFLRSPCERLGLEDDMGRQTVLPFAQQLIHTYSQPARQPCQPCLRALPGHNLTVIHEKARSSIACQITNRRI